MDTIKIVNEIIKFGKDYSNVPTFLKSNKKIDFLKIHDALTDLLFWQKTVYRSMAKGKALKNFSMFNTEQFNILENKDVYNDLLENCKELKHLFLIKNNIIIVNPSLTQYEVKEIRQIIENNFEPDIHI